ncbi:hypothetical protein TNCV_142611 [Trichonephila clavipes]|nr:hypothetical protein TNCV_142611 [Trichonephila clavipes]
MCRRYRDDSESHRYRVTNAVIVSYDAKKQRKRNDTITHNGPEKVLLKDYAPTGVRNYNQKSSEVREGLVERKPDMSYHPKDKADEVDSKNAGPNTDR